MGNMHLVTGYAGEEHIESNDDRSFNTAFYGHGEYVLVRGNQFAASIISNNKVRVLDGDIMMQGAHIRKKKNTYVEVNIDNGAQGYMRNDLIGVTYEKDTITGIEISNMVVIKGELFEGQQGDSDHDPEYIHGDIVDGGAVYNFMPLYRAELENLTLKELTPLFKTMGTFEKLIGQKSIQDMVSDAFSEVASYAIGDYCIYDDILYQFNTAKDAGPWNPENVQATTIAEQLSVLNNKIEDLSRRMGGYTLYNPPLTDEEYDAIETHDPNTIYFRRTD